MSFFTRKSLRRLREMIAALRSGDLTLHFSIDGLRGEERLLAEEINAAMSEFRSQMKRQEAQYGCYEAMLNQVDASLIVTDSEGHVTWMNDRAVHTLCGFRISDLSMLAAVNPRLPEVLASLQIGEKRLVRMHIDDHESQLKLSVSRYTRDGASFRLYTVENVQSVLLQNEMQAQRRLVSVLTHEIMNSLSPIISLSDTLRDTLAEGTEVDSDSVAALNAIHRRGSGLWEFVENYRKLQRVSQPSLEWTRIGTLIDTVRSLFHEPYIKYEVEDADIRLRLDPRQIEQVLINLIKNAVDACSRVSAPQIKVATRALHSTRHFLLTVTDNGCGIHPSTIDSLFVPFFTTKSHGSGIGLSLSRQIVVLHGGVIRVKSEGVGAEFIIQLPLEYKYE